MATLIQSKQIQGVVTASVIIGDFQVSGSTNLTGSVGVAGTLTATSLVGEGSGITGISFSQLVSVPSGLVSGSSQILLGSGIISGSSQVDYTALTNVPTFLPGENTTITSGSNIITISSTGGGANDSLNSFTASYFGDSASFDSRIDGINASGSGADFRTQNWGLNMTLTNNDGNVVSAFIFVNSEQTLVYNPNGVQVVQ